MLRAALLWVALGACFSRPELQLRDSGPTDGNDGGDDDAGDAGDAAECTQAVDPPDPSLNQLSLTRVSAGYFHACAIDSAGAMWCWGSNDHGQLGARTDSPGEQTGKPGRASTIANWTAVSASADHSCGIANDKVYCWGRNDNHQSSPPNAVGNDVLPTEVVIPTLQFPEAPTQVFAGETASCAITSLGRAFCWGDVDLNGGNDTGSEPEELVSTPNPGWASIALASEHACAIDLEGHIHCWGSNSVKQLGDPTAGNRRFDQVALRGGAQIFTSISATRQVTCATRDDGDLVCFGSTSAGHLGPVTAGTTESADQLVLDAGSWNRVSINSNHVCVAKGTAGAEVYCYGDNTDGAVGSGQFSGHRNLGSMVDSNAREITAGEGFSCVLDATNHLRCWGQNAHGELGLGVIATKKTPSTSLLPMGSCESVLQLASGDRHTCAIVGTNPDPAGRLYCWGENSNRQVTGLTAELSIPKPTQVFAGELFSRVATGERHTCALRSDGVIRCWGDNGAGQLGAGGTSPSMLSGPGGMPWVYVAAGSRATCAIRMGGDLYCWGDVPVAGLRSAPTSFGRVNENGFKNWTSISIGSGFGVGTAIDPSNPGRPYIFGFGPACQLATTNPVPPDVGIELYATNHVRVNVSAAQATGQHLCVHMNDADSTNKITCYGVNNNHQVGPNGTGCQGPEDPPAPPGGWRTAFPGLSTVTTSRTHSCALDAIGRPWCWGQNNSSELGTLPNDNSVPEKWIDTQFAEISTGADHTCGISDTRTSLSCWGENRFGQLGDNARFHASPTAAGLVPP